MAKGGQFRAVVVGGGIAGLTLANALEQAGVDYVLLERRGEIAPQVGASIGIMSNAARILDQLGAYDQLAEKMARVNAMVNHHENGKPIGEPTAVNDLVKARNGYEVTWGDRQTVLEVLRDNLRDKTKLLVNKQVTGIDHSADGVKVRCQDGSAYEGDVVVGADGVFSKVREEMWRLAEKERPALVQEDRDAIKVEFNCLFGIADLPRDWFETGRLDMSIGHGRCAALVPGKGARVYFFSSERLDKSYKLSDAPRYTDNAKEARAYIARNGDVKWGPRTLAEVWEKTHTFRLVPLEEGIFKMWTWGRIVCAGDSIHKATPNLAAGGNAAVESAAALANQIKLLADASKHGRPTEDQVRRGLVAYQETRQARAAEVIRLSDALIRVQCRSGLLEGLFVQYGLAHLADFMQDMAGDMIVGAVQLDYLPLPVRSLRVTEPFNPRQGSGFKESKFKRAFLALPFLALAAATLSALDLTVVFPWVEATVKKGVVQVGDVSVPILKTFYHVKGVDELFSAINTFFFPGIYGTDPIGRIQALSFLTDGAVLLAVWQLEAVRRANRLTPTQLPGVFLMLGQLLGLSVVAPLHGFLHYVLSPIEVFGALDRRLTNLRYTRAVLPASIVAWIIPLYAAYLHPSLPARQIWLFVWQLYPVWFWLSSWAFSRLFADTVDHDAFTAPTRDLPYIRLTVGAPAVLAAGFWIGAVLLGPYGLREIFVPTTLPRLTANLSDAALEFLRIDELVIFGSVFLWLAYLFADLKRAGMLGTGWPALLVFATVGVFAVGPGATAGLGWLWREEILATRKHKDARTEESLARLGLTAATETKRNGRK